MTLKLIPESDPKPQPLPNDPALTLALDASEKVIRKGIADVAMGMVESGRLLNERQAVVDAHNAAVSLWNKHRPKGADKMARMKFADDLKRHWANSDRWARECQRKADVWEYALTSDDPVVQAAIKRFQTGKATAADWGLLPEPPKQIRQDADDFLERLGQVAERLAGTSLTAVPGEDRDLRELAKLPTATEDTRGNAALAWENRLAKVEHVLKPEPDGEGWACRNLKETETLLRLPKKIRRRIKPLVIATSPREIKTLADLHAPTKENKTPTDIGPIVEELERGASSVLDARTRLKVARGEGHEYAVEYPPGLLAYMEGAKVRIRLLRSRMGELREEMERCLAWTDETACESGNPAGVLRRLCESGISDMKVQSDGLDKLNPWGPCETCRGEMNRDGKPCGTCAGQGWWSYGIAETQRGGGR